MCLISALAVIHCSIYDDVKKINFHFRSVLSILCVVLKERRSSSINEEQCQSVVERMINRTANP